MERYAYFIEKDGKWLSEDHKSLTIDPEKAMSFDTIGQAKGFLGIYRKELNLEGFIVTEHLFL